MFGKLILESHTGNAIVRVVGGCEDNYIISYFCKSLTGYMKNYIRDNKPKVYKKKYCTICGKEILLNSNRQKYCKDCLKQKQREWSLNNYYKNKF